MKNREQLTQIERPSKYKKDGSVNQSYEEDLEKYCDELEHTLHRAIDKITDYQRKFLNAGKAINSALANYETLKTSYIDDKLLTREEWARIFKNKE